MNALLKKELRTRMRGKTIFIVENAYLMLLTGVFLLTFLFSSAAHEGFGWKIGEGLFKTINYFQMLLLVVASPTIVASTFTLEREQKTFDMLLATPLSLSQIVWAKLLASLSIFLVLVLISLPMLSVCFFLGGVSPSEILWAYLLTLEGVFLAGAIGLYYSARFKRTLASAPLSSLTIIVFLLVTLLIGQAYAPSIALINPLYAFKVMNSNWATKFFAWETPFWLPSLILTTFLCLSIINYTIETLKEEKRRTSVWTRLLLFLFYSSMLTFLMGSKIEISLDFARVIPGFIQFLYAALLFSIFQAILCSGGDLSAVEQRKLFLSLKERYLRLRGCFGSGLLVGPRYSFVLSTVITAIFALGALCVPGLPRKGSSILLTGGVFVSCTMMYALLARLFSLTPRIRGKSLPRILAFLSFLIITFGPHLASYFTRKGAIQIPKTAWDMLIFLSPFVALYSILEPGGKLTSYPYCDALLRGTPFEIVTILLYLLLLALFWALNVLAERRIRSSMDCG